MHPFIVAAHRNAIDRSFSQAPVNCFEGQLIISLSEEFF